MAVPPPLPGTERTELRRSLRQARIAFVAAMNPSALAGALEKIERNLAPLLGREGPIAGYVAHKGEADILPFLLKAFHMGRTVALPNVTAQRMSFIRWSPEAILTPGLSGIPQPNGETIEPAIILAPLVGFDRAGHRLGQGGGYYDRWFAAHPHAMRVGIAWSVQEAPALTPEPWDMPLHAIVTEKEWIEP
jgi:5-formyltetrahydrofolate cyclo-ligase